MSQTLQREKNDVQAPANVYFETQARFDKVEEYNGKESWLMYTETLDASFNASDIGDDEKCSFLSAIGTSVDAALRSLLASAKPKKTYMELMVILSNHFSQPPSEIAESFFFQHRTPIWERKRGVRCQTLAGGGAL